MKRVMFCVSPLTSCLNKKAAPPTTPRLDERPILSTWYRLSHMTPERVPPSARGFPQPRNTLFSQYIDWIKKTSQQLAPTSRSCGAGIDDGASRRETPGTLRGTTNQFSERRMHGLGGNPEKGSPLHRQCMQALRGKAQPKGASGMLIWVPDTCTLGGSEQG